jgi:hypothetical protein
MLGRVVALMIGVTLLFGLFVPPVANANEAFARKRDSQPCAGWLASHFTTTSPDKWNGGTSNNCYTSHSVFVEVDAYSSNGQLYDFCTDTANNNVKCQLSYNTPGSCSPVQSPCVNHYHTWGSGGGFEEAGPYYAWSSSD